MVESLNEVMEFFEQQGEMYSKLRIKNILESEIEKLEDKREMLQNIYCESYEKSVDYFKTVGAIEELKKVKRRIEVYL